MFMSLKLIKLDLQNPRSRVNGNITLLKVQSNQLQLLHPVLTWRLQSTFNSDL